MHARGNSGRRIAVQGTLLALLILGGLGAPAVMPSSLPGAARVAAAPGQRCPDAQERAFLRRINQYRKQKGRTPLVLNKPLMLAAHTHSKDMTKMAKVNGHNLRGGITAKQNLINHGYPANRTSWGENLAFGTALDTGAEAFRGWRDSPDHNRVMLHAKFRAIGIARVYDPNSTYGWYWTTTFGGIVGTRPKC